jgi:hypothetical protein
MVGKSQSYFFGSCGSCCVVCRDVRTRRPGGELRDRDEDGYYE